MILFLVTLVLLSLEWFLQLVLAKARFFGIRYQVTEDKNRTIDQTSDLPWS
jgi:hypothetical protein